ncbi:ADP-forming succinate--CoA ligase subunit beta [Candidatus Fermentibacteria bacterium]|nr:MAG: ADP-forming succinate--CoA ligase subunit beta [Candidatus Fermentibacteria bacterium]
MLDSPLGAGQDADGAGASLSASASISQYGGKMKLHEFQGKEMLRSYGVSVPESLVGYFPDEVWKLSMQIGLPCVVKAQVLIGGRGKAGGVRYCTDFAQVRSFAGELLGKQLHTAQGSASVHRLLVEQAVDIQEEYYFAITMDRSLSVPLILVSRSGGMEIEEVTALDPSRLLRLPVNPYTGLIPCHIRQICAFLGLNDLQSREMDLFRKLYRLFIEKECLLLEINPLVRTGKNELIPLDIKMDVDENALFRQRDIMRLRDMSEWDEDETEARLSGMSFIKLEGDIGCMVNGAGLAMATMDFIQNCGRQPANFLDIGGTATPETIRKGFEILLRCPGVNTIFVNIFGGIVRCDRVASGILEALSAHDVQIPVLVRLGGAYVEEAREVLAGSATPVTVIDDMEQARAFLRQGRKMEV